MGRLYNSQKVTMQPIEAILLALLTLTLCSLLQLETAQLMIAEK